MYLQITLRDNIYYESSRGAIIDSNSITDVNFALLIFQLVDVRSRRGDLLESNLVYMGASARLPRQQHNALLPRNDIFRVFRYCTYCHCNTISVYIAAHLFLYEDIKYIYKTLIYSTSYNLHFVTLLCKYFALLQNNKKKCLPLG